MPPPCSARAMAPLGRRPDSWWHERVHPEDRPLVLQSLKAAIEGDARRWTGTYRFRSDDGSYADMVDRGFIIRDDEGRAIRAVGAMTDLTEQHRAEAEIRRMQAELVHVSRLSAMGAMASTLAHELNQPLTALGQLHQRREADRRAGGDRRSAPRRRPRLGARSARSAPARSCGGCASWSRAAPSR